MKLLAFSVRDGAVQAFLPPFFVRHVGEAMRSFADAVTDPNHQFAKHVSDFVLYRIGEFDDLSGLFEPLEPARIISGLEAQSSSGSA